MVSLVKSVVENVWKLLLECSCADRMASVWEPVWGVLSVVWDFALPWGGGGVNHIQPAALRDDWSLLLGPSLMTPKHVYKGYLGGILGPWLTEGCR